MHIFTHASKHIQACVYAHTRFCAHTYYISACLLNLKMPDCMHVNVYEGWHTHVTLPDHHLN